MKSKVFRIQCDIIEFLGDPKDINDALRIRLGIIKPVKHIKLKPSERKIVGLEFLNVSESKQFARNEWNWKSIENATRNINKKYKGERFYSFHHDVYYLFVTRYK